MSVSGSQYAGFFFFFFFLGGGSDTYFTSKFLGEFSRHRVGVPIIHHQPLWLWQAKNKTKQTKRQIQRVWTPNPHPHPMPDCPPNHNISLYCRIIEKVYRTWSACVHSWSGPLARMLPRELRRCTMSAGLLLNPMTGGIHCKVLWIVFHTLKISYKNQLLFSY